MVGNIFPFVPLVVFLAWIAVVVYGLILATRLVSAVEEIARSMAQRRTDTPGRDLRAE